MYMTFNLSSWIRHNAYTDSRNTAKESVFQTCIDITFIKNIGNIELSTTNIYTRLILVQTLVCTIQQSAKLAEHWPKVVIGHTNIFPFRNIYFNAIPPRDIKIDIIDINLITLRDLFLR